jgi:hypothetical protein
MEKHTEKFLLVVSTSRIYDLLLFLIFPGAVVLGVLFQKRWFGLIGVSFICVSWLLPGLFMILKVPWFAQAWLRGMNSHFPEAPWEQLTGRQKFSIYLYSSICFIASVSGAIMYTIPLLR